MYHFMLVAMGECTEDVAYYPFFLIQCQCKFGVMDVVCQRFAGDVFSDQDELIRRFGGEEILGVDDGAVGRQFVQGAVGVL